MRDLILNDDVVVNNEYLIEYSIVQEANRTNHTHIASNEIRTLFITMGSLSFSTTALYLIFLIVRTFNTFPWKKLIAFCFAKNANERITLKQLWLEIKSKCFLISHPIARVFFSFQFCELMFDTASFFVFSDYEHNRAICYYQYIMIQFFDLASSIWALMISIWMLCILVFKMKKFMVLELVSHCVVILCSLVLTIIPIATKSVGPTGAYCWIMADGVNFYIQMTYYGPLLIILPSMTILYIICAVFTLRKQCSIYRQTGRRRTITDVFSTIQLYSKIFIFPLIFITTYMVMISTRDIKVTKGAQNSTAFYVFPFLNAFFEFSLGFFVTLLFVISDLIPFCVGYSRRDTHNVVHIQIDDELEGIDYEKWENDDVTESLSGKC
jgi:hypothetical protein